jgi:serine/threonine-protein kinase
MSEVWTKWEGQVVDGFPLHRCLGVSDHSGVFLTEDPAHNLAAAALKLVPAIPTLAESQLAYWNAAATLSHPRLIRLLSAGRCQLGSLHCLYVVMEYAEQNLAHFLAQRTLTDREVQEMLPATLDAVAFLHSRNLVHGQLKPSNILVVGDQLKLASDTIRPAGGAAASISMASVYDPPEGGDGSFSTAGDIWAIGVTLYEALTRTTPTKPDERSHGVVLPPDFPTGCAQVIRECLSRRPVDRPSVANLQTWASKALHEAEASAAASAPARPEAPAGQVTASTTGAPASTALAGAVGGASASTAPGAAAVAELPSASTTRGTGAPGPGPSTGGATPDLGGRITIRAVVEREPPVQKEPRRSFLPFVLAAIAVLAVSWLGVRLFGGHSTSSSTPPVSSSPVPPQSAAQQTEPPTAPAPNPDASPSARFAEVVHEEMPKVSRSALATIHGHVRVAVRVAVDATGNVVSDTLADPGPSRYFARAATEAARKWKFGPAPENTARQWLLHFEFSRTGTTARAEQRS